MKKTYYQKKNYKKKKYNTNSKKKKNILETKTFKKLLSIFEDSFDFEKYHDFFLKARKLKRKIKFYVGKTCSGKTYLAHNDLANSKTGIYLAPLRLLALEGQEEQLKRGVICSYITGEEKDIVQNATHVSSTIEMLNLNKEVETAVIDEIQLMGDSSRGWAWSQALLGVPAKNIILTGSSNALPLVRRICTLLEEPLEVIYLDRLTKLKIEHVPISIDNIKSKDCIVAFSRNDVLYLKSRVEALGKKVSVIYGGLPPEVRREESRRFNQNETEVLVATDAIAMGLNLPIKRVIFYTTRKMINRKVINLTESEVQQIGGRAGRYKKEEIGYVNAFSYRDLKYIKKCFNSELPVIEKANILPTYEHIKIISKRLDTTNINKIMKQFQRYVKIDHEMFVLSDLNEIIKKAQFAKQLNLEMAYYFTVAPVDVKNKACMDYFKMFIDYVNNKKYVPNPILDSKVNKIVVEANELKSYESFIKICNLYNWLHFRYPVFFPNKQESTNEKMKAINIIIKSLEKLKLIKKCVRCGVKLPLEFPFRICDKCFLKPKRR